MNASWLRFVERKSLLSSEHRYFGNIFTRPSLGGQKLSLRWGVEKELWPLSYKV